MTSTITLSVPALTDNEIWFANAAAWSNYWSGVAGAVTLTAVSTAVYTASSFNSALAPSQITIDSDIFLLPSLAQFNSLLAAYNALNASYIQLRSELYNAGLISNA